MTDGDGGADSPGPPAEPLVLSAPERQVLEALRGRGDSPVLEEELARELKLPADTLRGTLQRLRSKHLARVQEEHLEVRRLSARGREALTKRLPERRLLNLLESHPEGLDPSGLAGAAFSEEERSAAIGFLRRGGYLEAGMPLRRKAEGPPGAPPFPAEAALEALASGGGSVDDALFQELRRRGLAEVERSTRRRWQVSDEGARLPLAAADRPALGPLTVDLLASGAWRDGAFRPYDVRAPVPYLTGARPHPYLAWLREFEDILVGLGFEQAVGPILETEFWNADVLFMPQEHPARSIQDVLGVEGVEGRPPPEALLHRVAAVHEGRALPGEARPFTPGWRTPYDVNVARRPVLRSQTTAVSARFLATRPKAPFRMYSLDRNFRRDAVDATHHVEFDQCEGVLGEAGTDLRHLIGVFQELAEAIGIRELRVRPSYFPFTEPSVEGYVRHPRLGWMETFPGGLLRPEVLRPLGVDVPVAAWGIGVTRLAMVALGVSDIRDLFDDDLARLRAGGG